MLIGLFIHFYFFFFLDNPQYHKTQITVNMVRNLNTDLLSFGNILMTKKNEWILLKITRK